MTQIVVFHLFFIFAKHLSHSKTLNALNILSFRFSLILTGTPPVLLSLYKPSTTLLSLLILCLLFSLSIACEISNLLCASPLFLF